MPDSMTPAIIFIQRYLSFQVPPFWMSAIFKFLLIKFNFEFPLSANLERTPLRNEFQYGS